MDRKEGRLAIWWTYRDLRQDRPETTGHPAPIKGGPCPGRNRSYGRRKFGAFLVDPMAAWKWLQKYGRPIRA